LLLDICSKTLETAPKDAAFDLEYFSIFAISANWFFKNSHDFLISSTVAIV
jgi:hypothetical protein